MNACFILSSLFEPPNYRGIVYFSTAHTVENRDLATIQFFTRNVFLMEYVAFVVLLMTAGAKHYNSLIRFVSSFLCEAHFLRLFCKDLYHIYLYASIVAKDAGTGLLQSPFLASLEGIKLSDCRVHVNLAPVTVRFFIDLIYYFM